MFTITYPDGATREYSEAKKMKEIIADISEGLERASVGALFNDKLVDKHTTINEDGALEVLKMDHPRAMEIFWHSSAHLMAYAIQRLYPEAKFSIGPSIDNGFYYDVDLEEQLGTDDLEAIEKEMKAIVKEGPKFTKEILSREAALELFKEKNEPYKLELIEDLPEDEQISLYHLGEFTDLCRGPHLEDVKQIKAIKLLSVAGAYWRGDEKNKMLTRIYGITFPKKKELDEYLTRLEEAKRRDHRKIGRDLDLFSFHEEGPGFPFFHGNGMILRNELESYWRNLQLERGYREIKTPMILNEALWHQSGHWDHYQENMYFTKIDDGDYAIKPMNCPGSILVYQSDMHSYRDLPIKLMEFGQVHRHELSGALHGLFRVRTFTQDDAHVFCLPSQIQEEIRKIIDLADDLYTTFGFQYKVELSTQPEDSMGSAEQWEVATNALKNALDEKGLAYEINEGDGAFYGPKIDYHLEDAIGRTWQCGTIQLDFQMPDRFGLEYTAEDGSKQQPVMIHRALLGSIERFMGILIEHFAGKFPLWLAPVQGIILPISEKYHDYAKKVQKEFEAQGLRVSMDERSEKIGKKIRDAQVRQINYMIVVGEKEENSGTISVRKRSGEELDPMSAESFIAQMNAEIEAKSYELQ
ncbi:MAG: threonine--tRNA ligase [Tissierellia bacterium]|nr:threonine--tRNA ligase [Tissierellia bacterium]